MYSPNTIRWLNINLKLEGFTSQEQVQNNDKFIKIESWWKSQENQTFNHLNVLEYESSFDKQILQLSWKPIKTEDLGQFTVYHPNLTTQLIVHNKNIEAQISYTDGNNRQSKFTGFTIDLDFTQETLFLWYGNPQQVRIFYKV